VVAIFTVIAAVFLSPSSPPPSPQPPLAAAQPQAAAGGPHAAASAESPPQAVADDSELLPLEFRGDGPVAAAQGDADCVEKLLEMGRGWPLLSPRWVGSSLAPGRS
jgi:hypothetical protein